MPALIFFNRSWRLSSDDLTVPALIELIIHFIWLIGTVILYFDSRLNTDCTDGNLLFAYVICMFVVMLLICINLVAIVIISLRGSIMNEYPRRHIPKLLYLRFSLFVVEVICNVLGSYWVFNPHLRCNDRTIVVSVIIIVLISWGLFLFILIAVALLFDPIGAGRDEATISKSIKLWERRMRLICCCCCFCGCNQDEHTNNAFRDIAELITQFFRDMNLVISDVAAGLMLLSSAENANTRRCSFPVTKEPQYVLPWMTAVHANCYIKYAVACYGWPMYMFEHFFTGLCHLWPKLRCCSCVRLNHGLIIEDNCCLCHMAAVNTMTHAEARNFVYVSFHNRVFETPFYIVIDHETSSIVIAIRGTISFRDVLTDLSADYEVLSLGDSSEKFYAHKGILNAARSVKDKLINMRLLEEPFSNYPDYNLVITGHSLGAGTAALLAILLHPIYPNLRCYAFSPPGCLLNEALYEASKNYIMSVVVGDDLVISISWQSMEEFKLKLINALQESTLPKYRILIGGCVKATCGSSQTKTVESVSDDVDEGINDAVAATSMPLLREQVGRSQLYSTEVKVNTSNGEELGFDTLLFPPGRIFHICKVEDDYVCTWSDPRNFRHLVVSPTMASNHMPNYVQQVLSDIVKNSSIEA